MKLLLGVKSRESLAVRDLTSLTGSFMRYVGVGDLADYPDDDGTDAWLAGALGISVEQLGTLRQALASSPIYGVRLPAVYQDAPDARVLGGHGRT